MKIFKGIVLAILYMSTLSVYFIVVPFLFQITTLYFSMFKTIQFFKPTNMFRTIQDMAFNAGINFATIGLFLLIIVYVIIDQNQRRRSK